MHAKSARRSFWLQQLHSWHWISAAVSLCSMMLFAVTGITLNYAEVFAGKRSVKEYSASMPEPLLRQLVELEDDSTQAVPEPIARWVARELKVQVAKRETETSADEIYIALPMPGGDAWLTIDRQTGDVLYRKTTNGWVAYLNDLHKGRNTGPVWFWFQNIFAVACIIFTATGLVLLWMHGRSRPGTWPLTWLSFLAPLLIALLLIH